MEITFEKLYKDIKNSKTPIIEKCYIGKIIDSYNFGEHCCDFCLFNKEKYNPRYHNSSLGKPFCSLNNRMLTQRTFVLNLLVKKFPSLLLEEKTK